jgi:hypothetical protein
MTEISAIIFDEWRPDSGVPWATITGRIQTKVPNFMNWSRDRQESEHLWNECRHVQEVTNYQLCNECLERFKCWTACETRTTWDRSYARMNVGMDYAQMEARMLELMNKAQESQIIR